MFLPPSAGGILPQGCRSSERLSAPVLPPRRRTRNHVLPEMPDTPGALPRYSAFHTGNMRCYGMPAVEMSGLKYRIHSFCGSRSGGDESHPPPVWRTGSRCPPAVSGSVHTKTSPPGSSMSCQTRQHFQAHARRHPSGLPRSQQSLRRSAHTTHGLILPRSLPHWAEAASRGNSFHRKRPAEVFYGSFLSVWSFSDS